jgi:hypothetical protein
MSEQDVDEKLLHRVSFRFSEVPLLTGRMLDQYLSCSGSSLVVVHASRQWTPSAIDCHRCPMRDPGAKEFLLNSERRHSGFANERLPEMRTSAYENQQRTA